MSHGVNRPNGYGGGQPLGMSRPGTSGQFKAKGGSGEKKPPGIEKRGSGEKMPPGIAKKYQDGFEAQDAQAAANQSLLATLLGGVFSSVPTTVPDGTKPAFDSSAPSASGAPPASSSSSSLPPVDLSTAPQQGKAPDLPYISQYTPDGANKDGYTNADANCGPAILAMIAKSRGQTVGDATTDAKLINNLGTIAGTNATGTSGNGMIDGLESLGMQTAAQPGADLAWINNQLAQGRTVIANGDFYSMPDRYDPVKQAGHYISVIGVDNGNYQVVDPASQNVTNLSAQQLQSFIASHPEGGFSISAW